MGNDEIESGGDAMAEFASTYSEWHYLAGGACLGFVGGWLARTLWEPVRRRVAP